MWIDSHCRVGANTSFPAGSSMMGLGDTWIAGSHSSPKLHLSASEWVTAHSTFLLPSGRRAGTPVFSEEKQSSAARGPCTGRLELEPQLSQ